MLDGWNKVSVVSEQIIKNVYPEELLTTLDGTGVALPTELPGLNHPSGGGGSKKRKGDEQEENSRVSMSEHVVESGWKVEEVGRLEMLFHQGIQVELIERGSIYGHI